MNESSKPAGQLSPLKQALLALDEMQSKLDTLERAKSEPIAIIGIGCRFPGGANDPEAFWQLMRDEVDAISEVPADRWNIDDYYVCRFNILFYFPDYGWSHCLTDVNLTLN